MDGHTESEQAELSRLRTIIRHDLNKKRLQEPQQDSLENMLPTKYSNIQIFIFGGIPSLILFVILLYLGLVN